MTAAHERAASRTTADQGRASGPGRPRHRGPHTPVPASWRDPRWRPGFSASKPLGNPPYRPALPQISPCLAPRRPNIADGAGSRQPLQAPVQGAADTRKAENRKGGQRGERTARRRVCKGIDKDGAFRPRLVASRTASPRSHSPAQSAHGTAVKTMAPLSRWNGKTFTNVFPETHSDPHTTVAEIRAYGRISAPGSAVFCGRIMSGHMGMWAS
jgi:hypothetical protein